MIPHPARRRVSLHRQFMRQKLVVKLLTIFLGLLAVGFIFSFIVLAWYAKDLPAPGKLSQATSASTVFFDRDDKVLFELSKDKNRIPVKIQDISTNLKEGTVAIEDKNFYKHKGVSETGILRSVFSILFKRQIQGGSTITQQLIKNTLLGPQQTASRKLKEILLAYEVERRYTKDQILEMYLNEAPYGGTFYGIESASMGYFAKSSKDLSILESAFLAGLPQSPSVYSPFIGRKDAWKARTRDVLRRMREDKYITSQEEKAAAAKINTLKFSSARLSINAPHFVFYVRDWLVKQYGEKILEQGLKVKTTLSLDIQKKTEEIVKQEVEKLKGIKVGNGAAVVIDSQSGEVLAMVGSYDFNNDDYGKYNVAAQGLRQPGSALKPIIYATAFDKGYTPSTMIMDLKTVFSAQGSQSFIPVNYDGKFRGPTQLRFALGNSYNIPAVKLLAMVGLKDFLTKANDMGLTTLAPTTENQRRFGLAIALGGGEVTLLDLTSAYSVFARGGMQKNYTPVLEVKDYKGKKIYKAPNNKEVKVFSPESAFLTSHILSDNIARSDAFGPNSYLRIPGKTVAVKTGTTDDKRDNWTVGFTRSITAGVWVGNNDNSPMNPKVASGITGASPIWSRIMRELLTKYSDGIMDKPARVKSLEIDAFLGGLPYEGSPKRSEYFIEGNEPKDVSPFYKKLKISKANGKLANDVEIKSGNYEEKSFIVITENDPVSIDGKNRWQEAIEEWRKTQGDDKYKYPTETSDANADSVVISIKSPGDHQTVGNPVNVRAKIISGGSIRNVKILINGSEKKSWDEDKRDIDENFDLGDGTYEIKIIAKNDKDKTSDSTVKIGINKPWDQGAVTPTVTPNP